MADYTRIHRLLQIITLVQSERDLNAAALAERCGTTERTIYRDLKQIEGAGIPIHFEAATGGYRVRRDFHMPPVRLTGEEALALAALCEQIGEAGQIPFLGPALRALHKIESILPVEVQGAVADLARTMSIRTGATAPGEGYEDVYDRVRQSLAERVVLACKYESVGDGDGDDESFEFRPYSLFFGTRAWYAVGLHSGRDAVRTLKLNRFTKITLTDRKYVIPDDFSMDEHLGNAWHMIRGDVEHEVAIRFDAEFAQNIADTRWHRTQTIEWHPDNSCTFRCTVAGLDEIQWWVLSMGPHAAVLAPPELARRISDLAAATVAAQNAVPTT